jgi:hypothetical protein
MTITNTQLAAALMALGYELLPIEFDVAEVVFDFGSEPDIADYQTDWRELSCLPAATVLGDTPLEIMFRMSKARQWLLKQVIHGHHNEGITLPEKTLATSDLHLAVALVGNGCYLLKLDKGSRLFHFAESALPEKMRYELPSEWYGYARNYLVTLDQLVRLINNRNLTGQQRANVITSNKPYPTKQPSKYARA